ncbi:MAG: restriction endonuclease [Chthoniobacteraceae bacterium]
MEKFSLVTEGETPKSITPLWVGREAELSKLELRYRRKEASHAAIIGQRGTGKTALAYMFRELTAQSDLFPGGWHQINARQFYGMDVDRLRDALVEKEVSRRSLLFIDDYIEGYTAFDQVIHAHLKRNPAQNVLVCSLGVPPTWLREPEIIALGGLSQAEFFELIRRRFNFSGADERQAQKLFELAAGSPLYADLAGKTIREHLMTMNELVLGLGSFSRSGILGPDGHPLDSLPRDSQLAIVDTNRVLIQKIRKEPDLLYSVNSRKFEEIVADLLSEKGYDITLTPPSKDGGFDMYAARKDDLGSFLYLVECKQYTPPGKVGVSIIRALHGVVQKQQANAGIVVTSSFFTKGAKAFQEEIPYQMQLKDYLELQKWLGII